MDFKETAASGQFSYKLPQFGTSIKDKDLEHRKSRMAGDFMNEFYTETPYQPRDKTTTDANIAMAGMQNPYDQYLEDKSVKYGLDNMERRKDWKHSNTTPDTTENFDFS